METVFTQIAEDVFKMDKNIIVGTILFIRRYYYL